MTEPKSNPTDLDKDLEADREISEALEERLNRLDRETAPPQPKPDHANDGGVF